MWSPPKSRWSTNFSVMWSGVHVVHVVHLESNWRPPGIQVDFGQNLAGLSAKANPPGVHLESMGECKVLEKGIPIEIAYSLPFGRQVITRLHRTLVKRYIHCNNICKLSHPIQEPAPSIFYFFSQHVGLLMATWFHQCRGYYAMQGRDFGPANKYLDDPSQFKFQLVLCQDDWRVEKKLTLTAYKPCQGWKKTVQGMNILPSSRQKSKMHIIHGPP